MFIEGYEKLAREVKDIVEGGGAKELADICGVTSVYISQLAKGQKLRPSAESLQKIADGVSAHQAKKA